MRSLASTRSRPWLAAFVLTVVLAASAVGISAQNAVAQCNGASCLPGSGYTWDNYWNCGLIYSGQWCYQPGNCLGVSCADRHTFGWGSADYDGSGTIFVYIGLSGGSAPRAALGGGYGLARTCWRNDCNDQDAYTMYGLVSWQKAGSTARHTIIGHAKA
jgi:hypothetical protein